MLCIKWGGLEMNQFRLIAIYSNSLAFQLARLHIVSILLRLWGSQSLNFLLVRLLRSCTSSIRTRLIRAVGGDIKPSTSSDSPSKLQSTHLYYKFLIKQPNKSQQSHI